MDLGLLQRELAERLGVSKASVWLWESGRQAPALRQWPRLIVFLGFDPRPKVETIGERLKRHREAQGWSRGRRGERPGHQWHSALALGDRPTSAQRPVLIEGLFVSWRRSQASP
jgi:transcriptional regulator with XRE-family HTH domain